ncbi:hypothetical protein GCM10009737_08600 [Nocardioides lentus]|uniref:MmyB-like transcription regulator ligand binding domain-containing protein n=1 Tax=Nocardioides lentus TaxID=338077 RepID=A0ABN2P275_9ACTN
MTTSPSTTSSSSTGADTAPGSSARGPLRLALRAPARGTPLDGAWHPRSRDLAVEVADLVDHFPVSAGRVGRLLFSRPDWDSEPGERSLRRITAARGAVKVGSFPRDDTHLMIVKLSPDHALRLLVVPSELDEDTARRIMDRAVADDNTLGADELLAAERPGS